MRNPLKLPFLASILLAIAFPRLNFFWLAWIACVPLFLGIRRTGSLVKAFGIGYFFGAAFLLMSIHWLKEVSVFGLFFVVAYQAFYFGIFSLFTRFVFERCGLSAGRQGKAPFSSLAFAILSLPACWVLLEWVRSEIPVMGFGWNLLAYSQAENLILIQSAGLLGAYGVSFLIMMVNVVVFLAMILADRWARIVAGLMGLVPLAMNVLYGGFEIRRSTEGPVVQTCVVQGNVEQEKKWAPDLKEMIIEKYVKLSELASFDGPDLVVWPEAAYPGFLNVDFRTSRIPGLVKRLGFPFVIGGPHYESERAYFNSAYLVSSEGEIVDRYDKNRLVPFGEYIPFKPVLSFLEPYAYALGVSDFSAGDRPKVFEITLKDTGQRVRFSTMICFEDIFPALSREFVRRGAQCLMVVTNDAWFGQTGAPYQHLQASVFRAIENATPVVRAGNIGVSSFISPTGKVEDKVQNERGFETYVTGVLTRPVVFRQGTTFYQRAGYRFPAACLVITVLGFSVLLQRKARADRFIPSREGIKKVRR